MEKVVSAINPQYQYIAKLYLYYRQDQWNKLDIGDLALNSLELTDILYRYTPKTKEELGQLLQNYHDWAVKCALNIAINLHYSGKNSLEKRKILSILCSQGSLSIDKNGFID